MPLEKCSLGQTIDAASCDLKPCQVYAQEKKSRKKILVKIDLRRESFYFLAIPESI